MRYKGTVLTGGSIIRGELVPISDLLSTGWDEGAGDADGDRFDELDDGKDNFDDATTYAISPTSGGSGILKLHMTKRATPLDPATMVVRCRLKRNGANNVNPVNIYVYEGTTLRSTNTTTASSSWTTNSEAQDLSALVDWTNVRIWIQNNAGAYRVDVSGVSIDES